MARRASSPSSALSAVGSSTVAGFRFGTDPAAAVPHALRADGVYLGLGLSPALGFVKRYTAVHRDLAQRLVSSATLLYDPSVIALARGVVVAGSLPVEPTAAEAAYAAAFSKAFPAIPAAAAIDPITIPYRDGVEALLEAYERSGRAAGAPLQAALARLELDSPTGRIRLDAQPAGDRPELPQSDCDRLEGQARRPDRAGGAECRADFRRLFQGGWAAAQSDKSRLHEAGTPPPLGALISL